jgi:hypothetical protein
MYMYSGAQFALPITVFIVSDFAISPCLIFPESHQLRPNILRVNIFKGKVVVGQYGEGGSIQQAQKFSKGERG